MIGSAAGLFGPISVVPRTVFVNPPSVGTTVAWTLGTYFDSYTSQSGVTTNDLANTNNMCWQLYYAWKDLTISAAANTTAINTAINGNNTVTFVRSVGNVTDAARYFPAATTISSAATNYVAGGFNQYTTTVSTTIKAGQYFLIGVTNGPFYRSFKTLADNRTAQVSGESYVTAINKVWHGGWPTGPTSGIPTQLGGTTSGYTQYDGYAPVISVKFS